MKKQPLWTPVVTALILRSDEVLLGKRPLKKKLPNLWEFPGGKIEPNESPDAALKRELEEELGIKAQIGPLLLATTHQYEDTHILLLFYEVKQWKGLLQTLHHQELTWTSLDKITHYELPDANKKIIPIIQQRI